MRFSIATLFLLCLLISISQAAHHHKKESKKPAIEHPVGAQHGAAMPVMLLPGVTRPSQLSDGQRVRVRASMAPQSDSEDSVAAVIGDMGSRTVPTTVDPDEQDKEVDDASEPESEPVPTTFVPAPLTKQGSRHGLVPARRSKASTLMIYFVPLAILVGLFSVIYYMMCCRSSGLP